MLQKLCRKAVPQRTGSFRLGNTSALDHLFDRFLQHSGRNMLLGASGDSDTP